MFVYTHIHIRRYIYTYMYIRTFIQANLYIVYRYDDGCTTRHAHRNTYVHVCVHLYIYVFLDKVMSFSWRVMYI